MKILERFLFMGLDEDYSPRAELQDALKQYSNFRKGGKDAFISRGIGEKYVKKTDTRRELFRM